VKNLLVALFLLAAVAFIAPAAEAQRGFGNSVAIADGLVLVGEPSNRANPGYVYVYRYAGGEWAEYRSFTAPDASEGDGFGRAIDADDKLVLISAVNGEGGRIYVYERGEDGEWHEAGSIEPTAGDPGDRFGNAIARDGDRLIVGAPSADDQWGGAYIFEVQDYEWVQVAHLEGTRPEPEDEAAEATEAEGADGEEEEGAESEEITPPDAERFGSAVALAGDWAMVGAPSANQRAGLVYVYHRSEEGVWEQAAVLGDFAEENHRLGSSIHLTESEAFVGAPGYLVIGGVRRFVLDEASDEWTLMAGLFPFDGLVNDFGAGTIVADGEHVYVGAASSDGGRGVIYRYTRAGRDNWGEVSKIAPGNLAQRHRFAGAFAVSDGTLVAGLPGADFGAGKAVIMNRSYGGWDSTVVASEAKGIEPITGAALRCDDGTVDRFSCEGIDLMAFLPISAIGGDRGVMANDIWGWTDPETDRDYAIVGLSNATVFVDVTEPTNPVPVGILRMTAGATPSVWRDIKVHADHAFIVSDSAGQHGMQVFDLTHLREFDGEPIEFWSDADYGDIASAHNIVINEDSAFAFIVGASGGGETCGGGLHMVNIEDPKNPMFAGCFQDTRTGRRGTGYSHDAQCVIYHGPDERYAGHEICMGSNETALSIADVTDKRNPVAIGMASYPNVAYSHQGWLTDDHRYFYMNDEGDEASGLVTGTRTIIWDVQDLTDPIVAQEYVSDNPAVDHNLYVVGNVMYQSNYDSGLRLFDVSDPENIAPIGFLDTVPFGEDGQGMGGSWSNYPYFKSGIVVVTSMQEGFFVARIRDEAKPDDVSSPDSNE
jgi:choice-of-anchor B domain-containing protein